jgi:hypothetical protein
MHAKGENDTCSATYLAVSTVSRFRGITICMYHDDHEPPHFHARYAGERLKMNIHTLEVVRGEMAKPQTRLIRRWAALHRIALLNNWRLARSHATLSRINPL